MLTSISNKPDNVQHFSDDIFDCINKQDDWDGAVGIATCYGLDNPGFKPWWKLDFLDSSGLAPWPTQPPE
jgi:hypothetical protein